MSLIQVLSLERDDEMGTYSVVEMASNGPQRYVDTSFMTVVPIPSSRSMP
jgi:hypothetical protein